MNFLDVKLLQDLEINNNLIPSIDNTITSYGKIKFRELLNIIYFDEKPLMRRKEIIKTIIQNPKNTKKIIRELHSIKKYEKNINWLFDCQKKELNDLYFQKDFFNSTDLLSTKNFLKIYAPSLLILVYLFIYVILKYCGISIDIKQYFYGIYKSTYFIIMGTLSLIMNNICLISFLTNMLATLYILYQLYSVYNSVDSSISHYNKCHDFNKHIDNIRNVVDSIKKIYKLDKFFFSEKNLILQYIKEIDDVFDESKLHKFGYKLITKKNNKDYELSFNKALQYIGLVDSFINIAKLVTKYNFIFPTFDFNKNMGPYIKTTGLWCPYIDQFKQVKNYCYLGNEKPNNIILTGPNTSGKSTYIRNTMIAILLAQTIGVTCADSLTVTPFSYLFTYLDIPNVYRDKESLFEAEVLRCMEYCKVIENMDKNQFTFTIMDELFTGTNPKEGIAASYSVVEYLGNFNNNLNIITTHFMELTDLEKQYPDKFKNMRFHIIKGKDNSFFRSYMIEEGASEQHIAIELLKQKGYNNIIINKALQKLKELNES